jgi:serine protease Do
VRGAFVAVVEPGAPAAKAGLRAGDIVVTMDGDSLIDDTHFITSLTQSRPGETVSLGIVRDRRPQMLNVTLGEFERPAPAQPAPPPPREVSQQLLGFTVRDRLPADNELNRYTGDVGVVVQSVLQYSGAWATEYLREGTIVLAVNGRTLRSAADFAASARNIQPGDPVSLLMHDRNVGAERVLTFRTRR